jgi:hypothetical protein
MFRATVSRTTKLAVDIFRRFMGHTLTDTVAVIRPDDTDISRMRSLR